MPCFSFVAPFPMLHAGCRDEAWTWMLCKVVQMEQIDWQSITIWLVEVIACITKRELHYGRNFLTIQQLNIIMLRTTCYLTTYLIYIMKHSIRVPRVFAAFLSMRDTFL